MLLLFETEQVPAEVRVKVIITWVQYDMKALLPFIQRRQTFFLFLDDSFDEGRGKRSNYAKNGT